MSTLVLEVQFSDDTHSTDMEFNDLTALSVWLHDHHQYDFEWLCLHDNNTDLVIDGWDDILQYIRENTGPVLPVHELDANAWDWIAKETAHLRSSMNDLSQCGDACNCMKCSAATIERSEMVNPSKSSCIALSKPQHSMEGSEWVTDPFDTYEPEELPHVPVGTLTFGELEDGAEFYVAMTWAYGSRNKLQKVMEDGEHNAVWCSATHIGELIPDGIRVVRA